MKPSSSARTWLASFVVVAAASQLGAPCDQTAPLTSNTIRLETPMLVVESPTYYSGSADVVVEIDALVQAVDLQLSWDPAAISLTQVVPHADFDDDGALALPVEIDAQAGVATAIVDFRHGPAVQGPVRVATVYFEAPNGAPGTLSVDGEIADPAGKLCPTAPGPAIETP